MHSRLLNRFVIIVGIILLSLLINIRISQKQCGNRYACYD